jgi:hypothetical protein
MPLDAPATLFRPAATESEHDALDMVRTYAGWAYDALLAAAKDIGTAAAHAPHGPGRERLIRARQIILAATDDIGIGAVHDAASDAAAAYTPEDAEPDTTVRDYHWFMGKVI